MVGLRRALNTAVSLTSTFSRRQSAKIIGQRCLATGSLAFDSEPVAKVPSKRQVASEAKRIQRVERDDWNNLLHVLWENGYRGKFPYVWLRDNAPAEHTYMISDAIRSRIMLFADLDPEVKPEHIVSSDSGVLISWPENAKAEYTTEWLRRRNLSDIEVVKDRADVSLKGNKITWGQVEMENKLIYYDFERCLQDDEYFLESLRFLFSYGIGLFDNVPQDNQQLQRLSDHLGYHYRTHYGDFFEVRVEPQPGNLTFTSRSLGLHTDHPYNEYMPSVQLLQCIRSAGVGGESEFVDGFRAAEQLRRDFPHYFKLLSTVPLEYVDHGRERLHHHLVAERPVINLNKDGEVDHIVWNNQMRSWFYDVPVDHLQDLYRAMKTWNDYLYKPENMILIKLQAGHMVWFDNLRVLHGRREFQKRRRKRCGKCTVCQCTTPQYYDLEEMDTDTSRHLQGGFFNWDALKSKIRTFEREMNLDHVQVSV